MMRLSNSFKYAIRGVKYAFRTELSFRIQSAIGIGIVILMVIFPLVAWERVTLLLLIAAVLTLELINTIFERIVDSFKPRVHPVVGHIKDMMAAAVLIVSVVAAFVGLIIFVPHMFG